MMKKRLCKSKRIFWAWPISKNSCPNHYLDKLLTRYVFVGVVSFWPMFIFIDESSQWLTHAEGLGRLSQILFLRRIEGEFWSGPGFCYAIFARKPRITRWKNFQNYRQKKLEKIVQKSHSREFEKVSCNIIPSPWGIELFNFDNYLYLGHICRNWPGMGLVCHTFVISKNAVYFRNNFHQIKF